MFPSFIFTFVEHNILRVYTVPAVLYRGVYILCSYSAYICRLTVARAPASTHLRIDPRSVAKWADADDVTGLGDCGGIRSDGSGVTSLDAAAATVISSLSKPGLPSAPSTSRALHRAETGAPRNVVAG